MDFDQDNWDPSPRDTVPKIAKEYEYDQLFEWVKNPESLNVTAIKENYDDKRMAKIGQALKHFYIESNDELCYKPKGKKK
ncbi:hypothetical protein SAMD00019534_085000 [Acytostelium subglobosum LB1]|uniref:hypothetical protein n=1 Tax=Acytostelium subglobosum LB1 TaxID=1410327 RepID=UPI0006447BC7|nr:hypothetical protein SAMD00019534_085000 [Acytostelium subglobosum LB1]GAM25325.1 hypothetical protein SAMD00019534_085000 [Acytostelium subglobosum LB1]|eukprot:XP_012751845.1 hypothetical protein SAMD00019534_085000 [Acytostelium subglobosum LB1]